MLYLKWGFCPHLHFWISSYILSLFQRAVCVNTKKMKRFALLVIAWMIQAVVAHAGSLVTWNNLLYNSLKGWNYGHVVNVEALYQIISIIIITWLCWKFWQESNVYGQSQIQASFLCTTKRFIIRLSDFYGKFKTWQSMGVICAYSLSRSLYTWIQ